MHKELNYDIMATEKDAAYDMQAKRLLGHKEILAQILIKTVDAFSDMPPEEVMACIEDEIYISTVPVDPGFTNREKESSGGGSRITGLNTENAELKEGLIRFDIIFYARVPERARTSKGSSPESPQTVKTPQTAGAPQTSEIPQAAGIPQAAETLQTEGTPQAGYQTVQIIINVEAQKDEPKTYNILNRAIFYVCRLISSQKDRDFVKMNYNDIKKVYSIWVCLGMEECVLDHVHLQKDTLLNEYQWKGDLDLLNIVMVGLPKKLPEREEKYELHRLLFALLNSDLPAAERIQIVEEECPTQVNCDLREELSEMCNLSQGVKEEARIQGREEGIAEGRALGKEEGIVEGISKRNATISLHMYKKGYALEEIAELTEQSVDDIRELVQSTSSH